MSSEGTGHPFTVTFTKTGDVRFLSHLDLVRLLERGLRRSNLPLRFTRGFNPHVKMSLGDALPVGVESLGEQVLIHLESQLAADEVHARLAEVLPSGVQIVSVLAGDHRRLEPADRWELGPHSAGLRAALEECLMEVGEGGAPTGAGIADLVETDTGIQLRLVDRDGRRLKIRDLVAKLRARDPSLAEVRARKMPQGDYS